LETDKTIRIGFTLPAAHWLGGKTYLRNLFASLEMLPNKPLTPVLFAGEGQTEVRVDFGGIEFVTTRMLDRKTPAWLRRKILAKVARKDLMLIRGLQHRDISVLSHSISLGNQSTIKTIGWVPDFQHVHLPEFFTAEERARRDRQYTEICTSYDKVIVSSQCADADLRAFSPQYAHKAELLRFVAKPMAVSDCTSLKELRRIYDFKESYFILPNQFWAHKNHRVVITALQLLKKRGKSAIVLATGSTKDYRNPAFFPALMQYAKECDVEDSFRVLGQVPFEHLGGLLRDAIALINPSKFEGWSTSVEEAKSAGKQVILSDIPVHKEQAPERGAYFSPDDPEKLAQLMADATRDFDVAADIAFQNRTRDRVPSRLTEFAKTYMGIVLRTTQNANNTRSG
jgi:glycosyltransferase involved in cell wall biosynthesis